MQHRSPSAFPFDSSASGSGATSGGSALSPNPSRTSDARGSTSPPGPLPPMQAIAGAQPRSPQASQPAHQHVPLLHAGCNDLPQPEYHGIAPKHVSVLGQEHQRQQCQQQLLPDPHPPAHRHRPGYPQECDQGGFLAHPRPDLQPLSHQAVVPRPTVQQYATLQHGASGYEGILPGLHQQQEQLQVQLQQQQQQLHQQQEHHVLLRSMLAFQHDAAPDPSDLPLLMLEAPVISTGPGELPLNGLERGAHQTHQLHQLPRHHLHPPLLQHQQQVQLQQLQQQQIVGMLPEHWSQLAGPGQGATVTQAPPLLAGTQVGMAPSLLPPPQLPPQPPPQPTPPCIDLGGSRGGAAIGLAAGRGPLTVSAAQAEQPAPAAQVTANNAAADANATAIATDADGAYPAAGLPHSKDRYIRVFDILYGNIRGRAKPEREWPARRAGEQQQIVYAAPRIHGGGMGSVTGASGSSVKLRPEGRLLLEASGRLKTNSQWPDGTPVKRYYLAAPGEMPEEEAKQLLGVSPLKHTELNSRETVWSYLDRVLIVVEGAEAEERLSPQPSARLDDVNPPHGLAVAAASRGGSGGSANGSGSGGSGVVAVHHHHVGGKRSAEADEEAVAGEQAEVAMDGDVSRLDRRGRQWRLALEQNYVYLFLEAVVMGNIEVMSHLLPHLPRRDDSGGAIAASTNTSGRNASRAGPGTRDTIAIAAGCPSGFGSRVAWDRVHTPWERRSALHLALQYNRLWPPSKDIASSSFGSNSNDASRQPLKTRYSYDVPHQPMKIRYRVVHWLLENSCCEPEPAPGCGPRRAGPAASPPGRQGRAGRSALVMQRNTNHSVPLLTLMRHADSDGQDWQPLVSLVMSYMSYEDYCQAHSKKGWEPHHMGSSCGSRPRGLSGSGPTADPLPGSRGCLRELLRCLLALAEEVVARRQAEKEQLARAAARRAGRGRGSGAAGSAGVRVAGMRGRGAAAKRAKQAGGEGVGVAPTGSAQLQNQRQYPQQRHVGSSQEQAPAAWTGSEAGVGAGPGAGAAVSPAARELVSGLLFHLRSPYYDGRLLDELAAEQGLTVEPAGDTAPSYAFALQQLSEQMAAATGAGLGALALEGSDSENGRREDQNRGGDGYEAEDGAAGDGDDDGEWDADRG